MDHFKRLKATWLDHIHDTAMRRRVAVGVLIIDGFALQGLDPTETADFYEIVVERHLKAATMLTTVTLLSVLPRGRPNRRWSLALGNRLVASVWPTTGPAVLSVRRTLARSPGDQAYFGSDT